MSATSTDTRDRILALPAGGDLDQAFAAIVMGWIESSAGGGWVTAEGGEIPTLPAFSTVNDWETIVMTDVSLHERHGLNVELNDPGYDYVFTGSAYTEDGRHIVTVAGREYPEAYCKTAIAAVLALRDEAQQ